MPDDRSRIEKLEAMAAQSASPAEAEVARLLLESLEGYRARIESPRALTRADVLARPNRTGRRLVVWYTDRWGRRVSVDADELISTFEQLSLSFEELNRCVQAAVAGIAKLQSVRLEVETD